MRSNRVIILLNIIPKKSVVHCFYTGCPTRYEHGLFEYRCKGSFFLHIKKTFNAKPTFSFVLFRARARVCVCLIWNYSVLYSCRPTADKWQKSHFPKRSNVHRISFTLALFGCYRSYIYIYIYACVTLPHIVWLTIMYLLFS